MHFKVDLCALSVLALCILLLFSFGTKSRWMLLLIKTPSMAAVKHLSCAGLLFNYSLYSNKPKNKNKKSAQNPPQLRIGVGQETFEGILWSQDPRPRKQMTQFWTTSARYRPFKQWAEVRMGALICLLLMLFHWFHSPNEKSLLYLYNVNDTILYIFLI